MTDQAVLPSLAQRLVSELMPIAVVVDGPDAALWARALEEAGATAETFDAAQGGSFDLAVLATDRRPAEQTARVAAIASVSERLLLLPEPGAESDTEAWFELLADHGYQPVVDYDAAYLGPGAFLVDRNATAAETDLDGFAERMAPPKPPPPPEPPPELLALRTEVGRLNAALAAAAARAEAWQARAEAAEADAAAMQEQVNAWSGLRAWVTARCAIGELNELAALRAATRTGGRASLLARLFGRADRPAPEEAAVLADLAVLRASPLFDAAWYVATNPSVAERGLDPVLHYRLFGAAAGADPGPWFDTQAYVERYPEARANPLLHAIRTGAADELARAIPG